MKAIVLNQQPELQEIELGELNKDQARVKVFYSGLCGSDMHKINGGAKGGANVLGHEFVGEIVEMARHDLLHKVGGIVACNPTLPCKSCSNCVAGLDNLCKGFKAIGRTQNGAFSEYIDIPIDNLYKIDDLPPRLAVLSDIIAVGLHAVEEFADDVRNKKCLIIGDGAIGSALACILSIKGARTIVLKGKHGENFDHLHRMVKNIEFLNVNDEQVSNFDVVFETVGRNQTHTIESAIRQVNVRGRLVFLGVFPADADISFNNRLLFLKEASLCASVAYKSKYFRDALQVLMENHWLEGLITHELSLTQFSDGVRIMNEKNKNLPVIKVIFNHKYQ